MKTTYFPSQNKIVTTSKDNQTNFFGYLDQGLSPTDASTKLGLSKRYGDLMACARDEGLCDVTNLPPTQVEGMQYVEFSPLVSPTDCDNLSGLQKAEIMTYSILRYYCIMIVILNKGQSYF